MLYLPMMHAESGAHVELLPNTYVSNDSHLRVVSIPFGRIRKTHGPTEREILLTTYENKLEV